MHSFKNNVIFTHERIGLLGSFILNRLYLACKKKLTYGSKFEVTFKIITFDVVTVFEKKSVIFNMKNMFKL